MTCIALIAHSEIADNQIPDLELSVAQMHDSVAYVGVGVVNYSVQCPQNYTAVSSAYFVRQCCNQATSVDTSDGIMLKGY